MILHLELPHRSSSYETTQVLCNSHPRRQFVLQSILTSSVPAGLSWVYTRVQHVMYVKKKVSLTAIREVRHVKMSTMS